MAEQINPGDRITLNFAASDGLWRRATQAGIIEWRLESHPDEFFVKSINYQQMNHLVFVVEIKKSAERLLTERRIANLILSYNPKGFTLIFKNATTEFIQKKVIPGAKAAGEGLEYAAILAIVILGLIVFMKTKK